MSTLHKTLGVCLGLVLWCIASQVDAQTVFDQNGFGANRDAYTVLPYEYVDPLSGNLILVVTDLTLPGNAGFSLAVQRVYNSAVYADYNSGNLALDEDSWAGVGWRLHFGRVLNESDDTPGATQIEMPDGSRHALYHSPTSDGWMTKDFWVYNKSTHILKMPNGVVYNFGRTIFLAGLGTVRYATEVHDPFNNSVSFTYFDGLLSNGPPDGVALIHQDLGQGQTRDISFTYNATFKSLASMTYNGMTWNYSQVAFGPTGYSALVGVTPPAGLPWGYEYEATPGYVGMTTMRVPGGGVISYTYGDANRVMGPITRRTRVVTQRTISGDRTTPGTWTFQYGQGPNQDTSIVSCPCGTTTYRYNGIGVNGPFAPWNSGSLAERTVSDNGVVLEREMVTWQQSEPISSDPIPGNGGLPGDPAVYNALPSTKVVTRGSTSWTSSLEYHTGLGNFNDYGRAFRITQSGELTRTTTNTFQYGFAPYIVNRVATEEMRIGSESVTSSYTYDLATGFMRSVNSLNVVTSFEPTAQGNVRWVEDANGHRTTFTYQWGVQENTTTPLLSTGRVIDSTGVVLSETTGSLTTHYEYDAGLRLKTVRPPGTNPIGYEYDDLYQGWVRIARDQAQSSLQLDGFGRTVHTTNRLNLQTRTERDACGRATFQSAPYTAGSGNRGVTTQYDALGRVTQTTAADGTSTTRLSYDGIDVTVTDAAGRVSYQHYAGFGNPGDARLIWVQDAAQQRTTYAYDVLGHLIDASGPGSGPHRQWFYDGKGRLHHDTQPETGTTYYEYDAVGNLTRATDANGQVTVLAYDANDRLTSRDLPGTDADVTWTLDAIGRIATQQTPLVTTTFAYDAAGRLASRTDQVGSLSKSSSYQYDGNDNQTQITYPTGRVVNYTYDIENRLLAVQQNGNAFAGSFTYDDSGRPISYVTGAVTHTISYDVRDRVSHLTMGVPGSPALDLTYHYDAVSRVLGIDDPRPSMTQSFGYDVLDRMTSANGAYGALAWTYDAGGNRLTDTRGGATTSYGYDPATLRLMSTSGASAETFTYDNVGRLTSDSRGRYSYLATGMLQRVTDAATGTTPLGQYTYDADDLRVKRDVGGRSMFNFRSPSGQTLSEYEDQCGTVVWTRDVIYAGGKAIGAVKADQTPPRVVFAGPLYNGPESWPSAGLTMFLYTADGQPLRCEVTVSYETRPVTATPHQDYIPISGTFRFPIGTPHGASHVFYVPLINDTMDEPDESFNLVLTGAVGARIDSPSVHTFVIEDDDLPPTIYTFDTEAYEDSGMIYFPVYVSTPSAFPVQFTYTTANETATAGLDYVQTTGTFTIPPGVASTTLAIPLIPDRLAEPKESFVIVTSNPVHGTLAWGASRGNILDDERPRAPIDQTKQGWYFADCSAEPSHSDYVVVGNPWSNTPITVRLTFTRPDGSGASREFTLAANHRVSLRLQDEASLVGDTAVSVAVQSLTAGYPVFAEHSLYWGDGWQGGRSSEGASPAPTWYLAEGSTGYFDEFITVFNPNDTPVDVRFEFYDYAGTQTVRNVTVPTGPGRYRLFVDEVFATGDNAARILATVNGSPANIVVERTMAWESDYREGHSSPGESAPATAWYFAEGGKGTFSTFMALFNPNSAPNHVHVTYLHENGTSYDTVVDLVPWARATVTPPVWLPDGAFGYRITSESGLPLAAERSMYAGSDWTVGDAGIGVSTLDTSYTLTEGSTGGFFDTYLLIANPSPTTAIDVTVWLIRADGGLAAAPVVNVPAGSRRSLLVDAVPGFENAEFQTNAFGTGQFVIERVMYWPSSYNSALMTAMSMAATGLVLEPVPVTPSAPAGPVQAYRHVTSGEPAGAAAVDAAARAANGEAPASMSGTTMSITSGVPWYGSSLTTGRRLWW